MGISSWTSRPISSQIESHGYNFVDFWSRCQKVSNPVSWVSFCRLLAPKTESLGVILSTSGADARKFQIESPGYRFVDYWNQGPENSHMEFPGFDFENRWNQGNQVQTSGNHFIDFWEQCRKVSKSCLLSTICLGEGYV